MTDHIVDANKMIDRLPYQLTTGVAATREGVQFASPLMVTVEYFPYDISELDEPLTIPWPDAAERLRYRDGEPWCREHIHDDNAIVCEQSTEDATLFDGGAVLTRLAAILCDDAESFRVLHWCIHNLGGTECTHS